MSAKTRALQTMVVFSTAALTYTLYNSSLTNEATSKAAPLKQQTIIPALVTAKSTDKHNASAANANSRSQGAVPSYCNPDESGI